MARTRRAQQGSRQSDHAVEDRSDALSDAEDDEGFSDAEEHFSDPEEELEDADEEDSAAADGGEGGGALPDPLPEPPKDMPRSWRDQCSTIKARLDLYIALFSMARWLPYYERLAAEAAERGGESKSRPDLSSLGPHAALVVIPIHEGAKPVVHLAGCDDFTPEGRRLVEAALQALVTALLVAREMAQKLAEVQRMGAKMKAALASLWRERKQAANQQQKKKQQQQQQQQQGQESSDGQRNAKPAAQSGKAAARPPSEVKLQLMRAAWQLVKALLVHRFGNEPKGAWKGHTCNGGQTAGVDNYRLQFTVPQLKQQQDGPEAEQQQQQQQQTCGCGGACMEARAYVGFPGEVPLLGPGDAWSNQAAQLAIIALLSSCPLLQPGGEHPALAAKATELLARWRSIEAAAPETAVAAAAAESAEPAPSAAGAAAPVAPGAPSSAAITQEPAPAAAAGTQHSVAGAIVAAASAVCKLITGPGGSEVGEPSGRAAPAKGAAAAAAAMGPMAASAAASQEGVGNMPPSGSSPAKQEPAGAGKTRFRMTQAAAAEAAALPPLFPVPAAEACATHAEEEGSAAAAAAGKGSLVAAGKGPSAVAAAAAEAGSSVAAAAQARKTAAAAAAAAPPARGRKRHVASAVKSSSDSPGALGGMLDDGLDDGGADALMQLANVCSQDQGKLCAAAQAHNAKRVRFEEPQQQPQDAAQQHRQKDQQQQEQRRSRGRPPSSRADTVPAWALVGADLARVPPPAAPAAAVVEAAGAVVQGAATGGAVARLLALLGRTTRAPFGASTTGDGNCLFSAVAQHAVVRARLSGSQPPQNPSKEQLKQWEAGHSQLRNEICVLAETAAVQHLVEDAEFSSSSSSRAPGPVMRKYMAVGSSSKASAYARAMREPCRVGQRGGCWGEELAVRLLAIQQKHTILVVSPSGRSDAALLVYPPWTAACGGGMAYSVSTTAHKCGLKVPAAAFNLDTLVLYYDGSSHYAFTWVQDPACCKAADVEEALAAFRVVAQQQQGVKVLEMKQQ